MTNREKLARELYGLCQMFTSAEIRNRAWRELSSYSKHDYLLMAKYVLDNYERKNKKERRMDKLFYKKKH